MLNDSGLLRALVEYKKDEMRDRQIKKIEDLLAKEKDTFEGDKMKAVSKAGYGLLKWVLAMVKYHHVAKNVEPKRKQVRELQQKKDQAEKELEDINEELGHLAKQIEELQEDEKLKSAELKQLKDDADAMQRNLEAAKQLIDGLSSERVRWTEDLKNQGTVKERLVGDCLLCASFLAYAGPFNHELRQAMIFEDWYQDVNTRSVMINPEFKLERLLTTDVEIAAWSGQGLPSDELSVQNGILATKSKRWPLCVDPQTQMVQWLKKKEEKNLTVKTFNDDYVKQLELAVQLGKPFLFEDLDEELDPMIDPLLEKAFVLSGGQKMIVLGDTQLEWSDNFKLYMTTKISNPRYSPEVMGKVSIVNCVITLDGLAAQLLNVVVGFERADLEAERVNLVQQTSENRQIQKQLEDQLLKALASSQGSILEDKELIDTLNKAKVKSTEIVAALESAEKTSAEIEKTRALYQKVAKRGSILYFAMAGLCMIESMYEYSLTSFLGVFEVALREAKPDRIIDNRLKNLREKITQTMYEYTCLGIFERHKLMFSLQMTSKIMDGDGELDHATWDFFLKGNPSLDKITAKKPVEWLTDAGWKDMQMLKNLEDEFATLADDLTKNPKVWHDWYELEAPEASPMPMKYGSLLNPFQQLLMLRCFRPDRIVNGIRNFVIFRMSDFYVQPPPLVYDKIYAQSNERSPIVFVLSPGADPQSDVQKLGDSMGFTAPTRFRFVSLGQGMGPVAAAQIETGFQRGYWVMLQNCHLLQSWLKSLEKILLQMPKTHKDFRLWLTTMPTDAFPLGILQRSLKVVTEPPDGLKLNMRQSYAKLTDPDLDTCDSLVFKPLVYVLAFFHAVTQDRRKFGRIGWNVPYDFNESDFKISFQLLELYLQKAYDAKGEIPWETLRYLIGEAMYGGRVTDAYDRRVLNTYLEEYMGDFLFDENQPFYFSQAGHDYTCPTEGDLVEYNGAINQLPLTQSPAVFGLHPNAEINYYLTSAREIWDGLISMQTGGAGGGGGVSKEEYIFNTAQEIMKKLPEEEIRFVKEAGIYTPTEVVLLQELERFVVLTTKMEESLAELKRALKGEIGMSAALEDLGNAMFNGKLPGQWAKAAPQNLKPLGSWMEHYTSRFEQYTAWAGEGDPVVFWLSGLHVPESLLSALVQAAARRKGWPLDKSTLYTECTKWSDPAEVPGKLLDGTYVRGLWLEGARWDLERGCLARQRPKELVMEMPLVTIIPVEANRLKLRDSFETPVYVTQSRRNAMGVGLVFPANLHTEEHLSIWTLQGVGLFLNTDS